jgi:hypothetical protein
MIEDWDPSFHHYFPDHKGDSMKSMKATALVACAGMLFAGCSDKKEVDANEPLTPAMTMALVKGDVNQVKALLDEGHGVEAKQDSRTPLCVAAMNGHVSVIQLLLARGAQVNYKDQNGMTPLMYAASSGKLDAVKALLEQKAEIEATTQMGETALMGAVGHGYVDVAKYLVEKGANIQAKMNNGRNVYIMAWERYNGPLPKKDDTALFVWLKEKADPKVAKQMDSAAKASEALVREVEAKTGGPKKK